MRVKTLIKDPAPPTGTAGIFTPRGTLPLMIGKCRTACWCCWDTHAARYTTLDNW